MPERFVPTMEAPEPSVDGPPLRPEEDDSFPVALRRFTQSLVGTDEEVWTRLLQIRFNRRNMTHREWRKALDGIRHEPAYRNL